MQCKKCGENFSGMFCPKCGTKIDDEQLKAVNNKNSGIIVKLIILFSIICFAFPFFNVSCSAAEEISVDYSGLQLVGIVETDKDNDKFSDDSGNNEKPNVFIGLSLIALAAGFVITFIKAAKKYTFICSLISAASLFLSKLTFASYYNFDDYNAEIIVKTKFGFYIAVIMILISALISFVVYSSNYGSSEKNAIPAVHNNPPVPVVPQPAVTDSTPSQQPQEQQTIPDQNNTTENTNTQKDTVPVSSPTEPTVNLEKTQSDPE